MRHKITDIAKVQNMDNDEVQTKCTRRFTVPPSKYRKGEYVDIHGSAKRCPECYPDSGS